MSHTQSFLMSNQKVMETEVGDEGEQRRTSLCPLQLCLLFLCRQLAKDMSAAAVRTIRKEIKELYINIQPLQEKEKAYGNGNGIM